MSDQVSRVGVLKISDVLLCEVLGIPVGCSILAVSHTEPGITALTLEGPSLPVATDPPAEVELIVEAVVPPRTRWAHDTEVAGTSGRAISPQDALLARVLFGLRKPVVEPTPLANIWDIVDGRGMFREATVPPPRTRWAHDVGTGLASADWPSWLPRPGIPVPRGG